MDWRFHHIGYAVRSIEETSSFYTKSGYVLSNSVIDLIQNTKIAYLTKAGMPDIELVAPINELSPIIKTLDKVGVSTYHVCYEVDNLEMAVQELRNNNFIALFKPVPAVGLNNHRICYLYSKQVGLIELVER